MSNSDFKENKTNWVKEIFSWIKTIIFALGLAFLINKFIIVNATVPTGSMENTIMPNDRIIALRLSYIIDEPERGDIVVFNYPDDENVLYVKRIVGVPGDVINIVQGDVFINDSQTPLEESYIKELSYGDYGPFEVPADSYFMLGDNRNESLDSRFWTNKYVHEDKILGKVYLKYFPSVTIIE